MRRVCIFTVLLPFAFVPLLSAQDAGKGANKDTDQIGASKGLNFYSVDKEIALGKQLSKELERHSTLVADKQVNDYLNRLGQRLALHADSKIPLTIKVIEGDDPNAVTLPGGFIYVQTGLLRTADTEAELAAALAHEIGHVAARHGTRQATHTQVTQITTFPLFFLPGIGGLCAIGSDHFVMPAALLAMQRGYETEADLLGLQYLYKAGYDPLEMVDIFEKIFSFDVRKDGVASKLLSTHPESGQRIVAIQKNIETLLKPQSQYVVNTSEFDDMQARLIALSWEPKPEPVAPKAPTLLKPGDALPKNQISSSQKTSQKLVPENDARASQIKEAILIR